MHPSENHAFLLSRVLAFALNVREGLEFSPGGLSDTDEPALKALSLNGTLELWIEIGSPASKKLHRAAKAAKEVKVYTYKDPQSLMREIQSNDIHRKERIEVYAFSPKFLEAIASHLEKDNRWSLVHTDGSLTLTHGTHVDQGEATRLQ